MAGIRFGMSLDSDFEERLNNIMRSLNATISAVEGKGAQLADVFQRIGNSSDKIGQLETEISNLSKTLDTLTSRTEYNVKTLKELDEAEEQLNKTFAEGGISQEKYKEQQQLINSERKDTLYTLQRQKEEIEATSNTLTALTDVYQSVAERMGNVSQSANQASQDVASLNSEIQRDDVSPSNNVANVYVEQLTSLKELKDEAQTLKEEINAIDELIANKSGMGFEARISQAQKVLDESIANRDKLRQSGDLSTEGEEAYIHIIEKQKQEVQELIDEYNRLNNIRAEKQGDLAAVEKRISDWKGEKREMEASNEERKKVASLNQEIGNSMKQLAKLSAGFLSVAALKRFIKQATQVRAEIEQMEIKLEALMGGKGRGLLKDIKNFAWEGAGGIYDVKTLGNAALTLSKFGKSAEEIMPLLRQLGEVAMGDGQKLNSLVMAFMRVEQMGKVNSLTLRMLINSGFNPLKEIARTTGESIEEVNAKLHAGKLTSADIMNALRTATEEGGAYNGMMEKMGETVRGHQEKLKSAFEQMYNDIGQQTSGVVVEAYEAVETLVKNYEKVGAVLLTLIKVWGTYRGAVLLGLALDRAKAFLASMNQLRMAIMGAKTAQEAFNAATLKHPLAAFLAVVMAVVGGIMSLKKVFGEQTEASERFGEAVQKEMRNIEGLFAILSTTSKTSKVHKQAQEELKKVADEYGITLNKENDLTQELIKHKKELIETIKAEAIERTHANLIQTAIDEYGDKIKEKQEDFADDMEGIVEKGTAKLLGAKLLEDEAALDATYQAYARYQALQKDVKAYEDNIARGGGAMTTGQSEYLNKQREQVKALEAEYETLAETQDDQVRRFLKSLGVSDDKIEKAIEYSRTYVNGVGEQNDVLNKSLKAYSNAADSARELEGGLNAANVSADTLIKTSKKLIEQWNTAHPSMTLSIDVDMSKIPDWIKNMSTEQLERSLKMRERAITRSKGGKGRTSVKGGSRTFGDDYKTNQEAAMMGVVLESRKPKKETPKIKSESEEKAEARAAKQKAKEAEKKAKEEADRNARAIEAEQAYQDELAEIRRKGEEARSKAEIAAIVNDGERERTERKAQHEQTIKDLKQQEEEIFQDIYEQRKNAYETANKNKKYANTEAGKAGWVAIKEQYDKSYTNQQGQLVYKNDNGKEQQFFTQREAEYFRLRQNIIIHGLNEEDYIWERYERERQEKSIDAMTAYLKEFGSIEERRLAIVQEYDDKIAKAQTEGERLQLQAQKTRDLVAFDREQAEKLIDWEGIFSNLATYSSEALEGFKNDLQQKLSAGDLNVEEYKTIVERIDEINSAIIDAQGQENGFLGFSLTANKELAKLKYQQRDAEKQAADAVGKRAIAEERLYQATQKAQKTIGKLGVSYSGEVSAATAQNILDASGFTPESAEYKQLQEALEGVAAASIELTTAKEVETEATNRVTRATQQLTGYMGDWQNRLSDFLSSDLTKVISANLQSLPELGEAIGLDMEKGVGKGLSDLAEAASNAEGALQDLVTGNFVGALAKTINSVRSQLSAWNNLLGLGIGKGNAEEVAKKTERLTESNDRLRNSVDKLKDQMSKEAGKSLISDYKDAVEKQKQIIEQTREILKGQNRYTHAHHSNAYYFKLQEQSWKSISDTLGKQVHSLEDIELLSPEDFDKIRTYLPEIWKEMLDAGEYDKSEFWENFADLAGELEDLEEQFYNALTQISFDSLRSNFMSALMDMDKDAADFAEDFENYMMQALLNALLGDEMDDMLKDFKERWGKMMESQGGKLTKSQIEAYRTEWDDMVQKGIEYRDMVAGITGYGSTAAQQEATTNALSGVSQDTANELVGRLTAIQIAGEQRNDLTTQVLASVQAIQSFSISNAGRMDEMTNILLSSNSYLEDVARYNKRIYEDFGDKLDALKREVVALQ